METQDEHKLVRCCVKDRGTSFCLKLHIDALKLCLRVSMGRQQAQAISSVNMEVGNLICLACMRNKQAVGCSKNMVNSGRSQTDFESVSGQNITMVLSTVTEQELHIAHSCIRWMPVHYKHINS